MFRSWNCTSAVAFYLWHIAKAKGSTVPEMLTSNSWDPGEQPKPGWDSLIGVQGLIRDKFFKLQWRGWLDGRVGSSYPVSKPRPVSPWSSGRRQTQRAWSNCLWPGPESRSPCWLQLDHRLSRELQEGVFWRTWCYSNTVCSVFIAEPAFYNTTTTFSSSF